ncbi:uncharacterized protein LOC122244021, partial [Penaeus japonicus]|uniref:uncharacterized protein LOC122244021 n=1 Tax=Penaeus japonicus TaxID=27405 RepID=UPI001C70DC23
MIKSILQCAAQDVARSCMSLIVQFTRSASKYSCTRYTSHRLTRRAAAAACILGCCKLICARAKNILFLCREKPGGRKLLVSKFIRASSEYEIVAEMGRLSLGACVALWCFIVALQPAQSAPPKGTERTPSGTSLRLPAGGLVVEEWPSTTAVKKLQQQRDQEQRDRAAPRGAVGLNRRRRRAALAHPAGNIFSPLDSDGSDKGAEMMKRALSLWATLHPLKSSVHEAAQRRHVLKPSGAAGETPLRPIGTQPLRWGR